MVHDHHDRFLPDLVHAFVQTDGYGGLGFSPAGGVDGGDQNKFGF